MINRNTSAVGREGEDKALRYLEQQGYKLLARNFSVKGGEIDLVMQDGKTLVFAEVKTRASQAFGGPLAAVTAAKQKRIARAAHIFVQTNRLKFDSIRFDVVAVCAPDITHLKNAFTPSRTLL